MKEAEQEKHAPEQIALQLDWHIPDHIKSQYADNVIVQAKRHDVTMAFFEIQLPPFAGTPEENRAFLEELGTIRADCVGKIVVAADLLPEIIKALQTAYAGYLATKGEQANV